MKFKFFCRFLQNPNVNVVNWPRFENFLWIYQQFCVVMIEMKQIHFKNILVIISGIIFYNKLFPPFRDFIIFPFLRWSRRDSPFFQSYSLTSIGVDYKAHHVNSSNKLWARLSRRINNLLESENDIFLMIQHWPFGKRFLNCFDKNRIKSIEITAF